MTAQDTAADEDRVEVDVLLGLTRQAGEAVRERADASAGDIVSSRYAVLR